MLTRGGSVNFNRTMILNPKNTKNTRDRAQTFHRFIMRAGQLTGCHQMPERSFFLGQYQFPLCARCTGLSIGYLISGTLLFWYRLPLWACLSCMALLFFDWYMQYLGLLPSTNRRRLLTGILCGCGYLHLLTRLFLWTAYIVKQLL